MTTKKCSTCNVEKDITEFVKSSRTKTGFSNPCKECHNKWYHEHKEEICKKNKEKYLDNPEPSRARAKEYRNNHLEESNARTKQWIENNRERYNENQRNWRRQAREQNPWMRIRDALSTRMRIALCEKNAEKTQFTMEYLGCSGEQLCCFLEAEFSSGMTWENYGEWHIDHIRPCASFNLEDPEEQKKCFHWTNLQPLWASDNIRKSDKWEGP